MASREVLRRAIAFLDDHRCGCTEEADVRASLLALVEAIPRKLDVELLGEAMYRYPDNPKKVAAEYAHLDRRRP